MVADEHQAVAAAQDQGHGHGELRGLGDLVHEDGAEVEVVEDVAACADSRGADDIRALEHLAPGCVLLHAPLFARVLRRPAPVPIATGRRRSFPWPLSLLRLAATAGDGFGLCLLRKAVQHDALERWGHLLRPPNADHLEAALVRTLCDVVHGHVAVRGGQQRPEAQLPREERQQPDAHVRLAGARRAVDEHHGAGQRSPDGLVLGAVQVPLLEVRGVDCGSWGQAVEDHVAGQQGLRH
mmetsp:Transcript_2929/g.8758  ORF Transcript_2929/g.8758 Transcript_2929/m.8758 type:complete len:239 (+) Transcript_2929:1474-2190(+)